MYISWNSEVHGRRGGNPSKMSLVQELAKQIALFKKKKKKLNCVTGEILSQESVFPSQASAEENFSSMSGTKLTFH